MKLKPGIETDILVIGSGIAGVTAAIAAVREGKSVLLTSSANIISGSTFYPGTWGFGLVGPEDQEDEEDLLETISRVGAGVVNKEVAKAFVEGLNPSVDELESLGVTLMKPSEDTKGEKEYIPCFDHKHRRWRGLTKKNLLETLPRILEDLGIRTLPFFQAIDLVRKDGQVTGAVGILDRKEPLYISSHAVVLATGGLGGLYKLRLTTDDVDGTGTAMAMRAGAAAVNLEFMQIMLGFVRPSFKTIFNEKTFFASKFTNLNGEEFIRNYLPDGLSEQEVLDSRSLHGPFSSATISRYLEIAFSKEMEKTDSTEIILGYDLERLNAGSEFVKAYFRWLKEEKGVSPDDKILLAPFMHASNGGIAIDGSARTSVPGLFACGECTGGMHGADRIGGLSTANGIVFGFKAGKSAAQVCSDKAPAQEADLDLFTIPEAKEKLEKLRNVMQRDAFLVRSSTSLERAMDVLDSMDMERENSHSIQEFIEANRLISSLMLAKACILAMEMREESRGSHYREDHPEKKDHLGRMIRVVLEKGEPHASFEGGNP